MKDKQYNRKEGKARSVIDSHLAVMYQVATWRERKELELKAVRAENKRLRIQLRLSGQFIDASDKQYDKLMAKTTGRVATVKPPKLGLVRFHVGGVTEIADTRIGG